MTNDHGDATQGTPPAPRRVRDDAEYEMIAGAGVAALALPLGDVGGVAAAFLTPPVARALKFADEKFRGQSDSNVQAMLDEGASAAHLSAEEFVDELASEPRRLLCLVSAVEGAKATAYDDKIRLLGRALAAAAHEEEPTRIDEEQLFIEAVRRLEAPHVLLLKTIERRTVARPGELDGATERELAEEIGDYFAGRGILQPLLRPLEFHGLARLHGSPGAWDANIADDIPPGAGGEGKWVPTRFGRHFLQRLAEAERTEAGESDPARDGTTSGSNWDL
ncbi:hypothetical protein AB0937_02375 [Streptomyces sp. NPDC047880]|uniref:hypothetical protein n=1 Tax=Streptomyces sp. NPDC047880 TaxID=3155626 RepID=UPI0034512447